MIVEADKAQEMEQDDEQHHIVGEALMAIAPRLPAVFKIATTPDRLPSLQQARSSPNSPRTHFVANSPQLSEHQVPIIPTMELDSYFELPL